MHGKTVLVIGHTCKLDSEALVLLLVLILEGIRNPISYFYVDKIDLSYLNLPEK